MPRPVVPILVSPIPVSRAWSSAACTGSTSAHAGEVFSLDRISTPAASSSAISAINADGESTTPLPMKIATPGRSAPEGMSRSTVLRPPMTSVWPALWPPWKRTTPCALSVSQSTILPLPSSPHCVPMTTTFLPMGSEAESVKESGNRCVRRLSPTRILPSSPDQDCVELTEIEGERGGGPRTPERLANAIVASTVADCGRLAGGEHGENRAVVVVIAAKIGKIDMQRFDARPRGLRKRIQRAERVGDRRRVRQDGAGLREHFRGGTIQRRQRRQRVAPDRRQFAAKLRYGGAVLGGDGDEQIAFLVRDAGSVRERPVNADVTEIEMQSRQTG